MRIYSMKATFGKLEHKTLTLQPGLNIIEAPNEWGKSTWCAFLIAMLYGIDTRAKSTKHHLADKERYQPWSGSPMEGAIELNWKGRDITIQRSTKGRIPMGQFRAFETRSGLEVPELTAENCGQMLLGVEKEVFTRAGFLRFTDLPVTDDEQLRRRLNALVTTGDESGSGELLEQKLKDLKNRCRYNRTGLIPQVREEKERSEEALQTYRMLQEQTNRLQEEIDAVEHRISLLRNHQDALHYQASEHSASKIREAEESVEQARQLLENLHQQTQQSPSRETAMKKIRRLKELQQELESVRMEEQMLPVAPSLPEPPKGFEGCTAKQAVIQAEWDRRELQALRIRKGPTATILLILGSLLLFVAFILFFNGKTVFSLIGASVGLALLGMAFVLLRIRKNRINRYQEKHFRLSQRYDCTDPNQWVEDARVYAAQWEKFRQDEECSGAIRSELERRREMLVAQSLTATHTKGLTNALDHWNDVLKLWDSYADASRNVRQVEKSLETLRSVTREVPPPAFEDTLSFNEPDTLRLLSDCSYELKQLLSKRGHLVGQLESMGSLEALQNKDAQLEQRLIKLEQTYAALDLAIKSLEQARLQLQRRFSPRITKSAQDLFSRLTAGRYTSITLSDDFSLQVRAEGEDILRSRHYRSDGTVDQLYLALRLAVAKELTPEAPMILDDAMVRFDNDRLASALEILSQEAETKQVILFTCHGREKKFLRKK